jgi:hypothetical protein
MLENYIGDHSGDSTTARLTAFVRVRKVRTSKGAMLANGQAGQLDGKCNRKNTASAVKPAMVKL